MKQIHVAAIGAVVAVVCLLIGVWAWHGSHSAVQNNTAGPVYAYVDLEHIMMSHPGYSHYHHLELEYNAMVAQYQFEQWNYSSKAAAQDKAAKQFGTSGMLMTAALDQELKAKVALKENELNQQMKQRYDELAKAKLAEQNGAGGPKDLQIVNLRLKLQTEALSTEERKAAEKQLYSLMRDNSTGSGLSEKSVQEITTAMVPYKEKLQKDLADYAVQVKGELEGRQQGSQELFQKQMGLLGDRPEPLVWNQEWKEKLSAKEAEIKKEKEAILADIRSKAAQVANEQGIEVIFSEYLGFGTALDVTDDIIVKLV